MPSQTHPAADRDPLAHDPVNAPMHYREHPSGVEAIQIAEHMSFLRGNAMKYLWRAGSKGDEKTHLEDLKKARWYLDREIANLEREQATREEYSPIPDAPQKNAWDGYPPSPGMSGRYRLQHRATGNHVEMMWHPNAFVWKEGYGLGAYQHTPEIAASSYTFIGVAPLGAPNIGGGV